PKDWVVRYNFPVSFINGGVLLENESDFIVVAPGYGLMFIEVKSSRSYRCTEGKWYRIDNDLGATLVREHPFIQATKAKNNIVSCICRKLWNKEKYDFPGIYGHIVALPRCKVDGGLPDSQAPEIIILERDMDNLKDKIITAFELFDGGRKNGLQFDGTKMSQILQFFNEDCILFTSEKSAIDEEDLLIHKLTKEQFDVFQNLLQVEKSAIAFGGAGTGKTMLAAWLASKLAREGHRVLLLCYNRVLGAELKSQFSRPNLKVSTYFQYALEYIKLAHMEFPKFSREEDVFEEKIPSIFCEAICYLKKIGAAPAYDYIFVDEAQDFNMFWWATLLEIMDEYKTKIFLFADSNQSLYKNTSSEFPDVDKEFHLTRNCRNTKIIAKYCTEIISDGNELVEDAVIGTKPIVIEPTFSVEHRAELIRTTVNEWLKNGIPPSKIALLSPFASDHNSCSLKKLKPMSNIPLTGLSPNQEDENLEKWQSDLAIWRSTIKSFKGMESSFVIITDVNESLCQQQNELYVACSRAKSRLVIIPVDDKAHNMCIKWVNAIEF
ncbi:MAG: AAA family ATPase, partial [bacterium]